MEEHRQIVVSREVPGIVAALYDARPIDAWHLMDASATEPRLLLMEIWQFMTVGWETILEANGVELPGPSILAFWLQVAQDSQNEIVPRAE